MATLVKNIIYKPNKIIQAASNSPKSNKLPLLLNFKKTFSDESELISSDSTEDSGNELINSQLEDLRIEAQNPMERDLKFLDQNKLDFEDYELELNFSFEI